MEKLSGAKFDLKKFEKPEVKGKGESAVIAKKKDGEAATIKAKEAKGSKDDVKWSAELGEKEKATKIPNFAMAFA